VQGGFAARWAGGKLSGLSRGLVAHTAGIPEIPPMSTGTLGEPLFGSLPNGGEGPGRENEFEEAVFGRHPNGLSFTICRSHRARRRVAWLGLMSFSPLARALIGPACLEWFTTSAPYEVGPRTVRGSPGSCRPLLPLVRVLRQKVLAHQGRQHQ
jgi:hypothetical protein